MKPCLFISVVENENETYIIHTKIGSFEKQQKENKGCYSVK